MQVRRSTLPLAVLTALAAVSALRADASGLQQKQAVLRISLTLVDSCEIELPAQPGVGADDTRVECSNFMPHRVTTAPLASAATPPATMEDRHGTPAVDLPPYAATAVDMESIPSAAHDDVTVATVTF